MSTESEVEEAVDFGPLACLMGPRDLDEAIEMIHCIPL